MAHAVIHGCIMCIHDVALLAWLLVNASGMRAASAQRPASHQGNEIVNMKNRRTKIVADVVSFKSSVAGASGDVTREGGKQLSGAAKSGMRRQQSSKKVKAATSLQIAGSRNSVGAEQPRVNETKAVDDAVVADMVA
jgi:hypothetical protein